MAQVDLTGIAISVIVLGLVTSIGATILFNVRDAVTLEAWANNETFTETGGATTGSYNTLTGPGCTAIASCRNATDGFTIPSTNYTTIIPTTTDGYCKIRFSSVGSNDTSFNGSSWNCAYSGGNTTQADYAVANDAMIGLGEYGNWFKILVIVGIAAVILGLIFLAFRPGRGGVPETY